MKGLIDYNNYVYFGHLCEVPKDVLNNLNEYYDQLQSHLPQDNLGYYKQWYVQTCKTTQQDSDISWVYWNDEDFLKPTKEFFHQYVPKIYRFRFSYLSKGKEVEYHARHMLPRIHIPLNDAGSLFYVKDKDGVEHSFCLEYGSAYFTNVTLLHKVTATKDIDRKNSFFCLTRFSDKKLNERFLK